MRVSLVADSQTDETRTGSRPVGRAALACRGLWNQITGTEGLVLAASAQKPRKQMSKLNRVEVSYSGEYLVTLAQAPRREYPSPWRSHLVVSRICASSSCPLACHVRHTGTFGCTSSVFGAH